MGSVSTKHTPAAPPYSQVITGRGNRWLRLFREALRDGKANDEGVIGLEGARLVEDALLSGQPIRAVLTSSSGERYLERLRPMLLSSTVVLRTSDQLFDSVADTRTPQGIAALVERREASIDDLLRGPAPLVAVLLEVQDPGNVGTIIRTAEAFGGTGVAAMAGTASPWTAKAIRASAGSVLRVPLLTGAAPTILLAQLRVSGVRICAAVTSGGDLLDKVNLKGPLAFLVGNEGAGLCAELVESADMQVRIPIARPVDSLNAAIAAALLFYEAARQRSSR